jgi:hypothetical protein
LRRKPLNQQLGFAQLKILAERSNQIETFEVSVDDLLDVGQVSMLNFLAWPTPTGDEVSNSSTFQVSDCLYHTSVNQRQHRQTAVKRKVIDRPLSRLHNRTTTQTRRDPDEHKINAIYADQRIPDEFTSKITPKVGPRARTNHAQHQRAWTSGYCTKRVSIPQAYKVKATSPCLCLLQSHLA